MRSPTISTPATTFMLPPAIAAISSDRQVETWYGRCVYDTFAIGQTPPCLLQVERQARARGSRAAAAGDGFSSPEYRGDGRPCRLRTRRLRGLHYHCRWHADPCLPDACRTDRRLRCP